VLAVQKSEVHVRHLFRESAAQVNMLDSEKKIVNYVDGARSWLHRCEHSLNLFLLLKKLQKINILGNYFACFSILVRE
jgi:hypothetical protein